jgi:plastocyanin
LIGCTPAPGGGAAPPEDGALLRQDPAQAVTEIVTARDMTFSPATVTVPVGGTVVWKFEGPSPHTTTSLEGSPQTWDSGIQGAGATYPVRFDRPGTYPYRCTLHAGMTGTVVVE